MTLPRRHRRQRRPASTVLLLPHRRLLPCRLTQLLRSLMNPETQAHRRRGRRHRLSLQDVPAASRRCHSLRRCGRRSSLRRCRRRRLRPPNLPRQKRHPSSLQAPVQLRASGPSPPSSEMPNQLPQPAPSHRGWRQLRCWPQSRLRAPWQPGQSRNPLRSSLPQLQHLLPPDKKRKSLFALGVKRLLAPGQRRRRGAALLRRRAQRVHRPPRRGRRLVHQPQVLIRRL